MLVTIMSLHRNTMEKSEYVMIHYNQNDIEQFDRIFRLRLINSLSGYKPANLIGTRSESGQPNLAIFSSVVHLGADPPLIGFIQRPLTIARHTYDNIKAKGVYTINHIHESFIEKAHSTSAKYDRSVSEFEATGLHEEYLEEFTAPFVKESQIKVGVEYINEIPIQENGTILMIGKIIHIFIAPDAHMADGVLKLDRVQDVVISGLNGYHRVEPIQSFRYARGEKYQEKGS